ncbi:hypothetical protein CHUAL_002753 [Chamberlinius hualienensis]
MKNSLISLLFVCVLCGFVLGLFPDPVVDDENKSSSSNDEIEFQERHTGPLRSFSTDEEEDLWARLVQRKFAGNLFPFPSQFQKKSSSGRVGSQQLKRKSGNRNFQTQVVSKEKFVFVKGNSSSIPSCIDRFRHLQTADPGRGSGKKKK